ncbi:MAG TPA: IPT/TIG domain-containing protein [Candidatus Bathyarchaeia archaeon]|nr:IPT/TIG domain-containing protein [Candidatus Bathyarchaeia archaeon]
MGRSPEVARSGKRCHVSTPSSGPAGTSVTIDGTGLIQTSAVKFGRVKATTFTVKSDSQVTAVVPAGLPAGAVTISITTPGGTGNSPTKFTVQ